MNMKGVLSIRKMMSVRNIILVRKSMLLAMLLLLLVSCSGGTNKPDDIVNDPTTKPGRQQPTLDAPDTSKSDGLQVVTVLLDTAPWTTHAIFYVAEDQHFFQKEGLKVQFKYFVRPEDRWVNIAEGNADFVIANPADFISVRQKVKGLISVAAIVRHSLHVVAYHPDAVSLPSELAGKRIGMTGIPLYDAEFLTMLGNQGVERRQVNEIDAGYNGVSAFTLREVDAAVGLLSAWEGVVLKDKRTAYGLWRPVDYGVPDRYESVLVAKRTSYHLDIAQRLKRALSQAEALLEKRPETAMTPLLKANPDLNADFLQQSLPIVIPNYRDIGVPFGEQSAKVWQSTINWMQQMSLVPTIKKDRNSEVDGPTNVNEMFMNP